MAKITITDDVDSQLAEIKDVVIAGPHVVGLGYTEIFTPQTPACQHKWRQSYGCNQPIIVCDICGTWEPD